MGVARRAPWLAVRIRRGARAARRPGSRIRAPCRVGLSTGTARGLEGSGLRGGDARDSGHRPLLLPLDLLPRAERGPLRAGHTRRPGLRDRRAGGASGREALAAALYRAPSPRDRGEGSPDHEPAAGRGGQLARLYSAPASFRSSFRSVSTSPASSGARMSFAVLIAAAWARSSVLRPLAVR